MSLCLLCETRKPKRFCPATRGDICTQCCGAEREVTVDCPLDCEYLREARKHDKPVPLTEDMVPHPDVRVTEAFLERNRELVTFLSFSLFESAMETPGATDADIREGLGALIKTYKTLDSGLIYETRPANPYADSIQQRLRARVEQLKQRLLEQSGVHTLRDNDVLGVLVFLDRLALMYNNGRRRGRAYLSVLYDSYAEAAAANAQQPPEGPSLIAP
ncbi:MAG: hypothetical protein R2729_30260 [Bryobacteraceae bacterium]